MVNKNQSDLYIYFYLHGLSLLNPRGSFCFITSNSWLDVGYGRDLQELLIRNCHIKMIIDNQARRSFAQADVNTVIILLSAPVERSGNLDNTSRFMGIVDSHLRGNDRHGCHSRENRNPFPYRRLWIPTCVGMTGMGVIPVKTGIHFLIAGYGFPLAWE